jgi:xanthine dehydrogenase accessory factor
MSELKAVIESARTLQARGEPCLLATLVAVRGSSYRRAGARLLIGSDGVTAGSVSGGCLERDLARRGWWRTAGGGAALVTYDAGTEDELGLRSGLGCGGAVDVLLAPLPPDGGVLAFIARCFARERSGVVATVFRSSDPALPVGGWLGVSADGEQQGTINDGRVLAEARAVAQIEGADATDVETDGGPWEARTVTLTSGAADLLLEPLRPPPHLFLMGSGPDGVPLIALAATLGWTTTVWDPRARFDTRARFARADHTRSGPAAAVAPLVDAAALPVAMVMGHDLERDREALAALLPTRARYVGVLGPRHRTERLATGLAGSLERLHAPAGLAIGAETPAEIALAVIAEIQTVLAEEAVGHLRDRPAIHRRPLPRPRPRLRAVGDAW